MIGFEFGAHPMMIFKIIKPYLFILILPFFRAFVQYLTIGKTSGTILFEFVLIVFISILAFLGWKNIKIRVKNGKLIINKGIFIKSRVSVNVNDISSAAIKRNIIDYKKTLTKEELLDYPMGARIYRLCRKIKLMQ